MILENMSEFNFKSSVCTSSEQSERLLALGLKKETADICLQSTLNVIWSPYILIDMPYSKVEALDLSKDVFRIIPAWSLGRLIEMMPKTIIMHFHTKEVSDTPYNRDLYAINILNSDNSIAEAVSIIEWLINEGNFNKEYLV